MTHVSMADSGFSIFDDVLSGPECDSLTEAIGVAPHQRAGTRNLMSLPMISSLAGDSRLRRLVRDLLGTDGIPFRATLFDKSRGANWHVLWHQDRALPLMNKVDCNGWGPWSKKRGVLYALAPASALERVVALRIHLDAARDTNGPLRVIPGSHKRGV